MFHLSLQLELVVQLLLLVSLAAEVLGLTGPLQMNQPEVCVDTKEPVC
jgi:hypothetical protein